MDSHTVVVTLEFHAMADDCISACERAMLAIGHTWGDLEPISIRVDCDQFYRNTDDLQVKPGSSGSTQCPGRKD